ncbi:GNAT family N-acetyltransferase [Cellulomonas fimi]|uniref:GCN5-related N-acetyltransferase n=1 Tax=Cellulomonas fimi (strain ATCC 484 / DSM 20113 / JCM 1341 / CCUG 24087 / LMG 16345 / NBRC 15513 / NCIMB 8980 / NCTC 7547 / NRS-133) TaxID=590998 RepID=F4H0A0_CELFA|nr:GNAT family N-acetyltransferase [Cellulomonas fimi]AEE46147.1 GCN5-related N-acetyltransferase [Cellulomonas fimi ATCC 484]NNH07066.1 GNAT family N-acetyltransferase [Cellulomonas fimi]VEH31820.1 Predicted acetyltransferase [Cellulomonas fimi]
MTAVLDRLPARWRAARVLLGGDPRWYDAHVVGDDDAVLLAAPSGTGPSLFGLGDRRGVERLVAAAVRDRAHPDSLLGRAGFVDRARWMTVARDAVPGPAVLGPLGLQPFSTWDWMAADALPPRHPAEVLVRPLDRHAEADAIRACLAVANPRTSAGPDGPDEAGWWGVDGPDGLHGVVGATVRGGGRAPTSWHVHGLAVLPQESGRGLGTALTATVVRSALAAGAEFVSLGLYADNERARRVYERLGFRTELRAASYGPPEADRPAP